MDTSTEKASVTMKASSQYGVKTSDGERLIWWRTVADEDHWHERFTESVAYVPDVARGSVNSSMVRLILKHMPKQGRILEAGCGSGWLVKLMRDAGYDAEGVDYSKELVASVNQAYPDLPVRFGDVTALDVPDHTYSGYISLGVIEHRWEGCGPFLIEAKRVMQPGGMLFFSVPYFNGLRKNQYAGTIDNDPKRHDDFYQYGFDEPFFRKAIAASGLELVTFEQYGLRRGLQEEMPQFQRLINSRIGKSLLDSVENNGIALNFAAHMIVAVARQPKG